MRKKNDLLDAYDASETELFYRNDTITVSSQLTKNKDNN